MIFSIRSKKMDTKNVNSNVIDKTNHQPFSKFYTFKTTIIILKYDIKMFKTLQ